MSIVPSFSWTNKSYGRQQTKTNNTKQLRAYTYSIKQISISAAMVGGHSAHAVRHANIHRIKQLHTHTMLMTNEYSTYMYLLFLVIISTCIHLYLLSPSIAYVMNCNDTYDTQ